MLRPWKPGKVSCGPAEDALRQEILAMEREGCRDWDDVRPGKNKFPATSPSVSVGCSQGMKHKDVLWG